ncbi:MAG: ABC transporter substrate-binding protein [Propionibacteriaceae bacterium]
MKRLPLVTLAIATLCTALAGCSDPKSASNTTQSPATNTVTVTNCGKEVTFKKAGSMVVNDTNITTIVLAVGARPLVKGVFVKQSDKDVMDAVYGEDSKSLTVIDTNYPSLETVIARTPDTMVAGWNYGFSDSKGFTPDILKEKGIDSYILTESCKQADGKARGLVDPWEALRSDLTNMGKITGNEDKAATAVTNIDTRLAAVKAAPAGAKKPTVFLFDSGKDAIFTSGKFGAPEAIITAAGAKNATSDVDNTWTEVGWEKLTASNPDIIAFVEYPGQTYQEKVAALKAHPASKDLEAVKNDRFINLPYVAWTSGPLNIDAAEALRVSMEGYGLLPKSGIKPGFDLASAVPQK